MTNISLSQLLAKQIVSSNAALNPSTDKLQQIQIGQVIQGKVLRATEKGQYLINFNGKEHIVDCALPLKINEIVKGKVLEVGNKIKLKKLDDETQFIEKSATKTDSNFYLLSEKNAFEFAKTNSNSLSSSEWKIVIECAIKTSKQELAVLSALFLKKLDLPLTVNNLNFLIQSLNKKIPIQPNNNQLHATLDETKQYAIEAFNCNQLIIELSKVIESYSLGMLDELHAYISQLKESTHTQTTNNQTDSDQDSNEFNSALAYLTLLNAQQGGSVHHRTFNMPLYLNDELVELEIACFDEFQEAQTPFKLNTKTIALSLELDKLGKVDINLRLLDNQISARFTTETESAANHLAQHTQALKTQFSEFGWNFNEAHYDTHATGDAMVVKNIMEYITKADSLSITL